VSVSEEFVAATIVFVALKKPLIGQVAYTQCLNEKRDVYDNR
jgi:hypothetical protein